MTPLPSPDQIRHARTLLSSRVFGPATVARLTGVPLRAVFRINRTLPKDRPFPKKRAAKYRQSLMNAGKKILARC